MISKDDWYRDRIEWRANQHKLFEKKCSKFEDLQSDQRSLVEKTSGLMGSPVLVFWESENRWTVLTTCQIVSCFGGNLHVVNLDDIGKQLTIVRPNELKSGDDLKRESDQILLKKTGVKIWAPAGSELFALMNILRMFPLGLPSS